MNEKVMSSSYGELSLGPSDDLLRLNKKAEQKERRQRRKKLQNEAEAPVRAEVAEYRRRAAIKAGVKGICTLSPVVMKERDVKLIKGYVYPGTTRAGRKYYRATFGYNNHRYGCSFDNEQAAYKWLEEKTKNLVETGKTPEVNRYKKNK